MLNKALPEPASEAVRAAYDIINTPCFGVERLCFMPVFSAVVVALICFLPWGIMHLCRRVRIFALLGPVLLCYAAGILLSLCFNALRADVSAASLFVNYTIPIAIPLILFSSDFSLLRHMAKGALLSFGAMCVSVIIMSVAAFFVFRDIIPETSGLCGMMIGLYTGGTPNLYAIGSALRVSDLAVAQSVTVDTVAGGVYFLLLISVVPPIIRRLLPYKLEKADTPAGSAGDTYADKSFDGIFSLKGLPCRIPAVVLAILCFGVSALAALLITGSLDSQWVVVIVMLAVTTLGIALSFVPRVRSMHDTFGTGQYFIYMFSLAMGLTLDFSTLGSGLIWMLLLFFFVQFGAVLLHLLFSRLMHINGELAVITSTAGIYGPAFIAPVANALKNRDVVLPGLLCGILGYAIGNYIGCAVGMLLSLL